MTLREAAARGIDRLRKAEWGMWAYLKIHISAGRLAPWASLFDRPAQETLREKTPQALLVVGDDADDWVPYTGILDKKDGI